ncbi:ADP-ribosylation factor-like protein [Leptomonas pyrrhocoris]|uniref:ADP-ribosylation factor-like protein n=1 Tax=Leptomonas pyrrhocoris TaxID=157538 RepID=A0A0M9G0Y3_LEPPY|nr:ADP-ribosylation factor-like protein [Leptomonas pyrrhocoris]KPA79949.1 ADP-ribosylation factor-like protein [Leptomonas pyrrhocoris]|eukprot:XP_015658388.1 ADP-ribosylation factor-like protein [Leptomonas pyrrhocoris]
MTEEEARIGYAKEHNIHHLFELMATKLLVNRPENPFAYLRTLLEDVERGEKNKASYDPTRVHFNDSRETSAVGLAGSSGAAEPQAADGAAAAAPSSSSSHKKKEKKNVTLATFGLDEAGKTCALAVLETGEAEPHYSPTVGFAPVKFPLDEYNLCIFDLGGAANFRGIWVHYYHDAHGIVYVMDSAASEERVAESLKVLQETLRHPYVQGKPLLVMANKKDLPGSRGVDVVPQGFIEEAMGDTPAPYRVIATCAIEDDPALVEGIEWLLDCVAKDYEALTARVARDCKTVKEEKDRQRAERLAAIQGE